mmetsp:Transcript_118859/g.331574  ORF Transcript_118859/g.331574 Transcript_118859/m.331574 type:complete len:335 (-) Transcript_118859:24-1028(-)
MPGRGLLGLGSLHLLRGPGLGCCNRLLRLGACVMLLTLDMGHLSSGSLQLLCGPSLGCLLGLLCCGNRNTGAFLFVLSLVFLSLGILQFLRGLGLGHALSLLRLGNCGAGTTLLTMGLCLLCCGLFHLLRGSGLGRLSRLPLRTGLAPSLSLLGRSSLHLLRSPGSDSRCRQLSLLRPGGRDTCTPLVSLGLGLLGFGSLQLLRGLGLGCLLGLLGLSNCGTGALLLVHGSGLLGLGSFQHLGRLGLHVCSLCIRGRRLPLCMLSHGLIRPRCLELPGCFGLHRGNPRKRIRSCTVLPCARGSGNEPEDCKQQGHLSTEHCARNGGTKMTRPMS